MHNVILPHAGSVSHPAQTLWLSLPMPGCKQRLRWSEAANADGQTSHSALASLCLEKWAWGELSVPMVQAICQATIEDGNTHAEVKELAKATTIKHLHDKIPANPISGAVTTTKMFMQVPGSSVQGCWQHIMLPHELFSALHQFDKICLWRSCVGVCRRNSEVLDANG